MKNKNTREMWKNALSQIDEKYIAEAAEIAPVSENGELRASPSKGGTGNLGFVFAAAAAVIVSFIGVGFIFNKTGIEPLSPATEGTSESSPRSDVPVSTTTAISSNGAITTSTIGEYTEITTAIAPIDREGYQAWFEEAEEIKEDYSRQIEEKEKEIAECEKLIDELKKRLETEKFKEKADYDSVTAKLHAEEIELGNLKLELEKLEADYYEQVLIIENNRKTYEELYPNEAQYEFESFDEALSNPFALLGDCYEGQDGLFHVSDEKWVVSDDFDLFREYFFGVWGEDYIIDDSEKDWVAASRSMYFDNFYKVGDNVLAIVYHGFAGGELRWLDMRNPDVLYEAYGGIGDFPNGFQINEDGTPAVFTRNKTSNETNEPENNYLSIYRLKELSKEYGIPLETLTDIEIQDENGAVYHDSEYNFYPMYLVFEADNRLVINTEARAPYGDDGRRISLIFEKFTGKWERTVDFRWTDSTILKGNLYSEKEMPSEIVIPEGITEIADNVFMDCTQIEKVTLPSTLRVIGAGAFKDCTNLKEINIPYGVTTIGERAFENCTSVYMVLPDTVTTIGDGAFAGCTQFGGTFKPDTMKPVTRTTDITVRTQDVDGEFIFEYYIDGVLQENMTETRKISGADEIKWSVEGYGIHKYVLEVTSVATNASGILYTMEVDFTTDPPTIKHNDTFDSMLLRKLLGSDFTLIRPVDSTFITTEYSEGEGGHDGIDYAGELGDNIYAAADGIVTAIQTDYEVGEGYGKYIIIDHGNGYTTSYTHMDSISVKMFAEVSAGDVIGKMGSTGWSTGPHLHFVLAKNGVPVDPHIYLGDPIQLIQPVGDVYPEDDILFGYGEYDGHKGIDYSGEKGQEIVAAANGTVSFAGWKDGYGNCVIIDHRNGYQTIYGHLDEIKIQVGDKVTTGHLIGTMGSTGVTTGAQLHFELLKDGENLNPADYIA